MFEIRDWREPGLKDRKLLRSEDDLVLVGHSEGSIVATKVLPLSE